MQKIIFGISLNAGSFHEKEGVYFFGENEFLRWLEHQLGLAWPAKNFSWLRTAYYRKVLQSFLEVRPEAFFADSFEADSYGSTTAILDLRDELRLSGWRFELKTGMPNRLKDLAELEAFMYQFLFDKGQVHFSNILENGFADRFLELESELSADVMPAFEVSLVEPLDLLPTWWQRLFLRLQELGISVSAHRPLVDKSSGSDLEKIAQVIENQSFKGEKITLEGDGSLVILRVPRDYDGLEQFAYGYRQRVGEQPFLVMPPDLKLPDLVFESDGLPVSGNTSVSDLRPSQQLIKLAHSFLWKPIDLGKILEFLNLPYSPLHSHLAIRLAGALQERPGFDNEAWNRALHEFGESEKVDEADKKAALFEYRFWFERKTYHQRSRIPKGEVFAIYLHLKDWAKSRLASKISGAIFMSIYRLALDMMDLLDAIDEQSVSILDLDKLSEIVIQATPATFKDREVGASNFAQDSGAVVFPFDEIVWFNFVSRGSDYIAPKFMNPEIAFLQSEQVRLTLPQAHNQLRKWKRYQPIRLAQKRLILIVPDKVEGVYANLHPLHYELEAMIQNINDITIDATQDPTAVQALFDVRETVEKTPRLDFLEGHLVSVSPVHVPDVIDGFSVTELDSFLFYPHNWFLRKQMKLYGSSLAKIKDIHLLMGNIAHKMFEELLIKKLHLADNEDISSWYGDAFMALIQSEGLPFLEFGKEPDLVAFRKKLFYSIFSFIQAINNNRWKVVATEETLQGKLGINPVKGITDVVLERDGQFLIVDLKWGGKTFRKDMLKSKEDIQLMLYSKYFGDETTWWDACFYVIRDGVFITRTPGLFDESELVSAKEPYVQIYGDMHERLMKTLDWRYEQLAKGQLELRTEETISTLDELYGEIAFDLLPMKTGNYKFDKFDKLLGLVV